MRIAFQLPITLRVIPSRADNASPARTEGSHVHTRRHSSHLKGSFESRSTFVRSLTSFGMTEGRKG
jgi:hypothetical protein